MRWNHHDFFEDLLALKSPSQKSRFARFFDLGSSIVEDRFYLMLYIDCSFKIPDWIWMSRAAAAIGVVGVLGSNHEFVKSAQ